MDLSIGFFGFLGAFGSVDRNSIFISVWGKKIWDRYVRTFWQCIGISYLSVRPESTVTRRVAGVIDARYDRHHISASSKVMAKEAEDLVSVFVIVGEYKNEEDVKVLLFEDGKYSSCHN